MNEKKTAEEAAYKFAEVILGQPAFDKDDTIVVGFLGGVEYAAQETAALREENELLKKSMKQGNEMYANLKFDDEPFTPYQLVLQENERLKEAVKVYKENLKRAVHTIFNNQHSVTRIQIIELVDEI